MKYLFTLILALLFMLACTPDKGGNNNGGAINPSEGVTVWGIVYADGTNTLQGVVVSDGLQCVQTDEKGYFEMKSDLARTRFITVSIPSGYSAQVDENGLPKFYHRVTDEERAKNLVKCSFTFPPIIDNSDRFTMFVAADPQTRPKTTKWDLVAYHSLDICNVLYRDMQEKAATITDRKVYGLMLGDIVHEHMPHYEDYTAWLKTLGFPMFNVIGNHDNDTSATNDTEGRRYFEQYLGPAYYSVNLGKWHLIVLDNLIMKINTGNGLLQQYDHGLTDEIWEWLQNDLSFVDRSTKIMVAAHAPMFMRSSLFDSSTAPGGHRSKYGELFCEFEEVHAWAGHTHITFNYVFPESSSRKGINVHTLARCTGEPFTNEWIASNTPRGYTVVEVDGENISWHLKPLKYQSEYTGFTTKKPQYKHRDWDYDEEGVARMRSDGSELDESYQMKVFAPGEYFKTFADMENFMNKGIEENRETEKVYVDIFLWDEKWELPKYNGVAMERVHQKEAYSLLDYEMKYHYYNYGHMMTGHDSHKTTDNDIFTIFRAPETRKSGTGTVTVKDRFGNEYSQTISW